MIATISTTKNKLEKTHDEKANGVKIRIKSEWYEFGEKSSKFFLNPEKQHTSLNQVRTLLCGEKEVTDKHKIDQDFMKISLRKNWNFKRKI